MRVEFVGMVAGKRALALKNILTPRFPFLALRFIEPFSFRVAAVSEILPLIPFTRLCFRMILMIPPRPSASYFAPGLVTTSILLIWLAGIDWSTSVMLLPNAVDGLPSIKKRILELPASSTLQSMSTEIWGIFFSIKDHLIYFILNQLLRRYNSHPLQSGYFF